MKKLYLYIVNPFREGGYIFVCAIDYFCKSYAQLHRRAKALESCLNTGSVDRFVVRLSKIEEVQPVQGELPF
jgi:hypothetical protein